MANAGHLLGLVVISSLLTTVSCKPKDKSQLKDLANSSNAKTGFFLPKIPAEFAFQVKRSIVKKTAQELRTRCSQPEVEGGKYSVTVTAAGEQILLVSSPSHEPMPVCSLEASNVVLAWSTFIAPKNLTDIFLTDIWIRHKPSEKAVAWVSPDGNESNMFLVRRPDSSASMPEPMLVNWVDHLRTAGNTMLYRVGNSVIHAGVNAVAYSFMEIGNQVWMMKGLYSDDDVKHGTVFWSADRVNYYSSNPSHKHLVHWKKQDKDSMDRVGRVEASAVKVPEVVKRAVAEQKKLGHAAYR